MHELSLFAQVPLARHAQVLNLLAGLSAMQPLEVYARHAVFQPIKPVVDTNQISKKKQTGPYQPQQLSLIQLVEGLSRDDFGKHDKTLQAHDGDAGMADGYAATAVASAPEQSNWSTRIQEIPEPEIKNLILRRVTEMPLKSADVSAYLDDDKYRFISEYYTEGHRLIHRDVILHLHRVLVARPLPDADTMRRTLPSLDDLVLMDASGAFLLEARVRIEDRTKPALVAVATERLLSVRKELKGAVELRMPERLSMDTRVKEGR
ncbi:hypothetical protein CAC42_7386 [Sphaceloma murrayae]|uniref:Mediator of RNA polymerase II transcription subunit 18 n=1 Tax=Sphaceloma murrayae TaxID=2082308 RepID=A0A2K1QWW4_9PEZI|nr:hypothetical protein CAC42_7386 [Sphaceloma murrayae]